MINIFLISVVVVAVLGIALFLVRGGQVASARCPHCMRLGRTNYYGHCRCPVCGTVFWLSEAGHSVQSLFVWQIVIGPLVALVFGSAFFVIVCFQSKGVQYALVPALL